MRVNRWIGPAHRNLIGPDDQQEAIMLLGIVLQGKTFRLLPGGKKSSPK